MAKRFEASLEQVGATTSKATVRTHTVFVDRPADKGGADRGPAGRISIDRFGWLLYKPSTCGNSCPRTPGQQRQGRSDRHVGWHTRTVHRIHVDSFGKKRRFRFAPEGGHHRRTCLPGCEHSQASSASGGHSAGSSAGLTIPEIKIADRTKV